MTNRINKVDQGYNRYITVEGAYSPQISENYKKNLPPGIYRLARDMKNNLYFVPQSSMTDQLIDLPDSVTEKVCAEVTQFWSAEMREKFDHFGLIYKRGVLLHGAPGTGKTCTIAKVMQWVVGEQGVVIFNPEAGMVSDAVSRIREIQPEIKVLVVFEEFDKYCNSSDFLSLLDGELQLDNVVYVATTNYLDRVPDRIKNRPSRFATVIEVGVPNEEARRAYLTAKLAGQTVDVAEWVGATKGMVIDQMKDLIVSVFCFNLTLKEALDKLKFMELSSDAAQDDDLDCSFEDADEFSATLKRLNNVEKEKAVSKRKTAMIKSLFAAKG